MPIDRSGRASPGPSKPCSSPMNEAAVIRSRPSRPASAPGSGWPSPPTSPPEDRQDIPRKRHPGDHRHDHDDQPECCPEVDACDARDAQRPAQRHADAPSPGTSRRSGRRTGGGCDRHRDARATRPVLRPASVGNVVIVISSGGVVLSTVSIVGHDARRAQMAGRRSRWWLVGIEVAEDGEHASMLVGGARELAAWRRCC